ncbi:MAG: hypothetical protein AAFQ84_13640, partial [Pseudomonadota bacterium]
IAAMPEAQGALTWQASDRGVATSLVDETRLPFRDGMFSRVILMHGKIAPKCRNPHSQRPRRHRAEGTGIKSFKGGHILTHELCYGRRNIRRQL